MKANLRVQTLGSAGKIWEDGDFETCKMDAYCHELSEEVEKERRLDPVRIVCCWEEQRENKKLGPNGDKIHEARLIMKYGGLTWTDPDKDENGVSFTRRVQHPKEMYFEKKRGANAYHILATRDDYDSECGQKVESGYNA